MTAAQRRQFDEIKQKEGRAKSCILNSLDDAIFPKITAAKTAKSIWDILKAAYQGNDKVKMVRLQTLRTQFETLKMTDSETIDQFMTKVMGVVNQLRMNGEELNDQRIVEKVLRCLPKKFDMIVTVFESGELTKLSVEELTGSLLAHEARINLDVSDLEHAFKSKASMDRGRGRGFRGRKSKGRGQSQSDDRSQVTETHSEKSQNDHGRRWIDKSKIQCHYCKKYGHYKSECRKLQYKNKANVTNTECETSDALFLACQVTVQVPNKDVWLVDSGCSNHMTGHSDLFSHLDTSFSSSIGLGDDR